MKNLLAAVTAFTMLIALSCVRIPSDLNLTAHITVDIRHIQQQAEDLLDYTEGLTDEIPGLEDTNADENGATWLKEAFGPMQMAHATQTKQTSPLLTDLAKKMRDRNKAVAEQKKPGLVGENNRGYLEVMVKKLEKDAALKNKVQKLAAAENADRKAYYKETVRLSNDKKITLTTLEGIHAMTRLSRAKKGELFQLPDKGGDFEKFRKTKIGMKLGKQCVPKTWVTIK